MSQKKSDSERMRDLSPMGIRVPHDLKKRIADAAETTGRSMNTVIIEALEDAYPHPFSREESRRMVKVSLLFHAGNPNGADHRQKMRKFLLAVLSLVLGETDPEAALQEIEKEDLEINNITLIRHMHWQKEMEDQILLAQLKRQSGPVERVRAP